MASGNRTPLRRVSRGSLSALARSQSGVTGSTGLEFLSPAMSDLVEEMESLMANYDTLDKLSKSLDTFNEAFASYLYVMKMNTLCVEWTEAPRSESFWHRIEALERERTNITSTIESLSAPNQSAAPNLAEVSYAVPSAPAAARSPSPTPLPAQKGAPRPDSSAARSRPGSSAQRSAPGAKKGKQPALSNKEKKIRAAWIEKIINQAPVDFRGRDINLRKAAEEVLEGLIEASTEVRPADLVKQPQLPPFMVNKCLIGFVGAKVVNKHNVNGVAMYSLSDLAYAQQPTKLA